MRPEIRPVIIGGKFCFLGKERNEFGVGVNEAFRKIVSLSRKNPKTCGLEVSQHGIELFLRLTEKVFQVYLLIKILHVALSLGGKP